MSKTAYGAYVPVRMTDEEHAALRSMADERACSVGAVVRWAVRKAVMREDAAVAELQREVGRLRYYIAELERVMSPDVRAICADEARKLAQEVEPAQ